MMKKRTRVKTAFNLAGCMRKPLNVTLVSCTRILQGDLESPSETESLDM